MRTKPFPKVMTYGDKYGPAMQIKDQAEADAYFELCVQHSMDLAACGRARFFGKTREEAEAHERTNLGYYAAYYDHETRLRVERLFDCKHPIFGAAKDGAPTPEEAFAAGAKMATRSDEGGQESGEDGKEKHHA